MSERHRVGLRVEASGPVNVYVVGEDLITAFKQGIRDDSSTYKFKDVTRLERKIELPFTPGSEWFLIIRNRGLEPVAIHYDLF
jgi:hypothetical protein